MKLKPYLCWCESFMPDVQFEFHCTDSGVARIMVMNEVNKELGICEDNVNPSDCVAMRLNWELTEGGEAVFDSQPLPTRSPNED